MSAMPSLTPVERTLLIALMAEGRPLRESADLANALGINVTASHRTKLVKLGLVKATPAPWTLELTEDGWTFLQTSFPADIPKQPMKLSGLQVLLARLRDRVGASGSNLKEFFTTNGHTASAVENKPANAETSASSDSDEYIATALQDMPSFSTRLKRLEPKVQESDRRDLEQMALAAEGVFQNIRMAARKRGLKTLHEKGANITFDAAFYDCPVGAREAETVQVVKSAIVKGSANEEIIVLRGLAQPLE